MSKVNAWLRTDGYWECYGCEAWGTLEGFRNGEHSCQ